MAGIREQERALARALEESKAAARREVAEVLSLRTIRVVVAEPDERWRARVAEALAERLDADEHWIREAVTSDEAIPLDWTDLWFACVRLDRPELDGAYVVERLLTWYPHVRIVAYAPDQLERWHDCLGRDARVLVVERSRLVETVLPAALQLVCEYRRSLSGAEERARAMQKLADRVDWNGSDEEVCRAEEDGGGTLKEREARIVRQVYARSGNNVAATARELGISRQSCYARLRALGLVRSKNGGRSAR